MGLQEYLTEYYPQIRFEKIWSIDSNTNFRLGQCEALVRLIISMPIMPDYREELLKISLIKGAQATTAIEGNTLTKEEIEQIQRGISMPPSKKYQEIEIRNILDAYNYLIQHVKLEKDKSLITVDLIKDFHYRIGKDLGEYFDAIPGKFRENEVIVGTYRPPNHEFINELMAELCKWLRDFFHFEKGQNFTDSIIQAIVTHVYIAWIHPFSDGNGRTARMLEFFLLLRGDMPYIASHILSNYYNETRTEYYRQLDLANKKKDLTDFISYAVLGLRDGLNQFLSKIQENQIHILWQKYIYDVFSEKSYQNMEVFKRRRRLALSLPIKGAFKMEEVFKHLDGDMIKKYGSKSDITLYRDLSELVDLKILKKVEDGYEANIELLGGFMTN